jgi:hypothetical protein
VLPVQPHRTVIPGVALQGQLGLLLITMRKKLSPARFGMLCYAS